MCGLRSVALNGRLGTVVSVGGMRAAELLEGEANAIAVKFENPAPAAGGTEDDNEVDGLGDDMSAAGSFSEILSDAPAGVASPKGVRQPLAPRL